MKSKLYLQQEFHNKGVEIKWQEIIIVINY